ncbi:MAG: response regulator [Magnetococcales bacterium]|nr:response regulator [Magnetococcales bacterium]NGZ27299.1 response regulator [Magnetococcales bacterium]
MITRLEAISKILIVDDVPANLYSLAQLLGSVQAEIIQARSGMEVLTLCLKHDFALILLDVNMPGMDGFEVADILRGSSQTRAIPIIFITASHLDELQQIRGYDSGAVDYITKPINDQVLLSKVKVILELYEQRQILARQAKMLDEKNQGLEREIQERQKAEANLLKITQSRITRQMLMQTALEPLTLADQMQKALLIILDVPWLTMLPRGAIFLIDPQSGKLKLTAQHELAVPLLTACASIEPGRCLCGKAAQTRQIIFTNHLDSDHEIRYEGIEPHGHYCVPILHKEVLLGVLNIYLAEGISRDPIHDELLSDIAQTLARIIEHRQMEQALHTARLQAEEASRARERFLATMSHEIRTPLNGIIGFSQLLTEYELPDQLGRYVEKIQKSGEHLLNLISDILDFSKIEAQGVTLEQIPFASGDFLEKTLDMVTLSAQKKGVELLLHRDADLPGTLVGDPNRLRQILLNLLSNAIKFTEQGQVVLQVSLLQRQENGILLSFTVRDNGIGITPEQAENLFKPFGQADNSTTRRFGGTGLGLVIADRLAHLMGGEIKMNSVPGQGSEFIATLSLQEANQEPQDSRTLPSGTFTASQAEGKRLLLVEDDEVNRLFILDYLKMIGFSGIEIAVDGEEALARLNTRACHLVLMDCQLPKMDGYQATREIRRRGISAMGGGHLPVIALTANAMAGDREKCLAAGMDDFLAKPLNIGALKQTLARWLAPEGREAPPESSHETLIMQDDTPLNEAEFAELQAMFGQHKLEQLIKAFLDSLPEKLKGIRMAVERGNTEAMGKTAHILKGNVGMMKATPMFDLCSKLVDLGRSGSLEGAEQLVEQLETQAERLSQTLNKMLVPEEETM